MAARGGGGKGERSQQEAGFGDSRGSGASENPKNVLAALQGPQKPRKFRNIPTEVDGLKFDSRRESERYLSLKDDLTDGRIRDLEVHPRFPFVIHEQDCGVYEADFCYIVAATGERVVEDVKSAATRKLRVYQQKRRLVWALYGLRITEIT